ncbi:hypothetical protein EW146_g1102 [Bondarzewia mesenterica]|uniref:Uncharacterized protein n=1 Tax=Bondarzewia mesenterica TaxID=1095465 RepID=A0A4S4M6S4_9AGAM|nr:hypothetical protein EW146_g1102 [Bondarzewia mesenterica]
MTSPVQPPHYVLISHSCQPANSSAPSTSLSHPIIQYHYADDSPLSLLPRSSNEHVLVLDYDSAEAANARTQSIGGSLAVIGVKVTDAPGASSASEEDSAQNNNMYILTTTTLCDDKAVDECVDPQASLARFKQRNAVLRQVLDYPEPQAVSLLSDSPLQTS